MPDDRLPTYLMMDAVTRQLNNQGISYYIAQRGDKMGGLLLVKISNMEGECRLLTQQRNLDGVLEWMGALREEITDEKSADEYISRACLRDPDLWVVEIEDRSMSNPFA